jgi:hypothetical protein
MMVAILIGLFLTGGLLTLVVAMKRTSTNQSGLSQLQDNERMAMQLVTDVVKSTGYYPSPLTNSAASQFGGHRFLHLCGAGAGRQRQLRCRSRPATPLPCAMRRPAPTT